MGFHNLIIFALYFHALVTFRCSCVLAVTSEDSSYIQYITPLNSGSAVSANNVSDISESSGSLKKYDWTLTWEMGAPNGNSRMLIFTNGQFPGPNLMVDEGDMVEVNIWRFQVSTKLTTFRLQCTIIYLSTLLSIGTAWCMLSS